MMINHNNSRFSFYFQYNWNLYIICKFFLIENSPILYPRLSKEIDRIKKISSLCIILIKQSENIRKSPCKSWAFVVSCIGKIYYSVLLVRFKG